MASTQFMHSYTWYTAVNITTLTSSVHRCIVRLVLARIVTHHGSFDLWLWSRGRGLCCLFYSVRSWKLHCDVTTIRSSFWCKPRPIFLMQMFEQPGVKFYVFYITKYNKVIRHFTAAVFYMSCLVTLGCRTGWEPVNQATQPSFPKHSLSHFDPLIECSNQIKNI